MPTCSRCTLKEAAPGDITRIVGELYFCPVHDLYVRPDEAACDHGEDEYGAKLAQRLNQ